MEAATKQKFLDAMQSRDLVLSPGKQLIADGTVQRCDVINKKPGSGSYLLRLDGPAAWGWYRNWTDGEKTTYWRDERHRALTDAEREELERHIEEARIKAEELAAEEAKAAASRAKGLWKSAKAAPAHHPYLKRKQIKPHGLRVDQYGSLLVPIYDVDEGLVNLQLIYPDGSKYFLSGGRVKGCAFEIEGSLDTVIVPEGFATGASINEATGYTVIVAFNASNLVEVARISRNRLQRTNEFIWQAHEQRDNDAGLQAEQRRNFVDTKLVIGADDDHKIKNNPGIMNGLAAARETRALIAVPWFGKHRDVKDTDFNDLARRFGNGLECVKKDIEKAVEPQVLLQERLLADPNSAFGTAMVKELAAWKLQDRVFYEQLLARLKGKGARVGELDRAVKNAIKQDAAKGGSGT